MSASMNKIKHIVTNIDQQAKHYENLQDEASRKALIAEAQSLIATLELPREYVQRTVFAEPARNTAAQLAIDLELFEGLVAAGEEGRNSAELAKPGDADPALLFEARILKHLAAMNVVEEIDADVYRGTALSTALTVPKFRDGIPFGLDATGRVFLDIPQYLAENRYRNPVGVSQGPFQYTHKTEREYFEWSIHENPKNGAAFKNYIRGYREGLPSWTRPDFYPAQAELANSLQKNDAILLVDVGGGFGQDLQDFYANNPSFHHASILQDRPAILSSIAPDSLHPSISTMPHDFFTPQPVRGARAYHLHSILHNWDDAHCRTILGHLRDAMTPGYSKMLIFENVVPDRAAHWQMTRLDWLMMATCAALERTERQWRELLGSVGLVVRRIWSVDETTESLIEVVVEGDEEERM
ncbi:hypothetical protein LTR66_012477 [Elasticomyces elasticus]|nr:hypothetical protein LTR66_012477 [Elasticomyces elasticus]